MITTKNGVYYAVIPYTDNLGVRRKKWVKSGTNKKEAESLERQLLVDRDRGEIIFGKRNSLAAYLQKWLDVAVLPNKKLSPSTKHFYEYHVGCIKTDIGHYDIAKLSPLEIEEWLVNESNKPDSKNTVKGRFATLRAALNRAVKWKLLPNNPCQMVDPPAKGKPKKKVWTEEQLQRYLDFIGHTNAVLPVAWAALCGLRRGESTGLLWDAIDGDRAKIFRSFERISVADAKSLEADEEAIVIWETESKQTVLALKKVKTDDSEGDVPIPDYIQELLIDIAAQQVKNKEKWGESYRAYGFIWAKEDGSPYAPDYARRLFLENIDAYNVALKPEQEALKLPVIRFHDLRHTHATILLKRKMPLKYVSRQLRHAQSSFTADIYQHVTKEMSYEPAEMMNTIFKNKNRSKGQ